MLRTRLEFSENSGDHEVTLWVSYDPGGGQPEVVHVDVHILADGEAFQYNDNANRNPDLENANGIQVSWHDRELPPGTWKDFKIHLRCAQGTQGPVIVVGYASDKVHGYSSHDDGWIVC